MNQPSIDYKDFIKPDKKENALKGEAQEELQIKQRGLYKDNKGAVHADNRHFAEYCSRRVDAFRLEDGTRYLRNRKKHIYQAVSETTAETIFMNIMNESSSGYYTNRMGEDVLKYFDKLIPVFEYYAADSEHLIFNNGTFYLKEQRFEQRFYSRIYNTSILNYSYDSEAECPRFKAFVRDIFQEDMELVNLVQECIGYTFCYGESPIDVLFYWYGGGRNGKSVLANIVSHLHGEDMVSAVPLNKISERFQTSAICNKAVNISPENSQKKLQDTSVIKSLTGRDKVVVEYKHKTAYSTYLTVKFIVLANHYLKADDNSTGFWSRIVTIPFWKVYVPKPSSGKLSSEQSYMDPKLEEKLLQELPGIFRWAMEGLKRLMENNWTMTRAKAAEQLKEQFMSIQQPAVLFCKNSIRQGSLDTCGKKSDKIKNSELHRKFKLWAKRKGIDLQELSVPQKFHPAIREAMKAQGISFKEKKDSTNNYYGILVKDVNKDEADCEF